VKEIFFLLILLLTMIFLMLIGCGGSAYYSKGEDVTIVGRVICSGPDPFSRRVMVLDTTGTIWIIQDGTIEGELFNLSGLVVGVTGAISSSSDNRLSLKAKSYRLLRTDRLIPVMGILKGKGDCLILENRVTRNRYVLVGRMSRLLKEFNDRKVWVCGELKKASSERKLHSPPDTVLVEEFGIVW